MTKEILRRMTMDHVQAGLLPVVGPQGMSLDYLMSDAFAQAVVWFSEKRNMSVNEIVHEFKRMNGLLGDKS